MLGETYELVTSRCRYLSEQVSHHPPIFAQHCQGYNWDFEKAGEAIQRFNGKVISVWDPSYGIFRFRVKQPDGSYKIETYSTSSAMLHIGNIFIGERYCEPHGNSKVINDDTGDYAEIEFKERGTWTTKFEDRNYVTALVKDRNGEVKFKVQGKYTGTLTATNVETNESWDIYTAPQFPVPPQPLNRTYGMNLYAMQMNTLPNKLRAKLPPTDTRLR